MVASSSVWMGCGGVEDEEDYVGFGHGFAGFGDAEGFGFVWWIREGLRYQ